MGGATVGLLLAAWGSRGLVAQLSRLDTEVLFNLTPDWRVLGFTGVMTLATAILFGMAPALRATSVLPVSALRGPGGSRAESAGRLTSGLIVVQIALSVDARRGGWSLYPHVRTTAERSAGVRQRPRPHRNGRHRSRTGSTPQRACRTTSVLPRLSVVCRGWPKAAASTDTPLSRASQAPLLFKAERVRNAVGPGWFATYGTRFLAGRDFSDQDSASAPPVAIVNQAFARKFFPDKNPLGRLIEERTIVGIVDDAVFATVRNGVRPTLYMPLAQSAWLWTTGTDGSVHQHSRRSRTGGSADAERLGCARHRRPRSGVFVPATAGVRRRFSVSGTYPVRTRGAVWRPRPPPDGTGALRRDCVCGQPPAVRDRDQDGAGRQERACADPRPRQEPRDHRRWSHPRARCRCDSDTSISRPSYLAWSRSIRSTFAGCGAACWPAWQRPPRSFQLFGQPGIDPLMALRSE